MPERRALGYLAISVTVAFGGLFYSFSVLITEEAAGAEFSTSALSTAYSGAVLVAGVIAFPIGRWADRHGIRSLLGLGGVLGGVGMVLYALAQEPWHLIVVSLVLLGPAGGMLFYEPAFVAVDRWFPAERRGRAIGVLTVVGGLAGPIFIPLTTVLVKGLGWRGACAALAVMIAGAAGWAAFVPTPPSHGAVHETQGGVDFRRAWRDRRFLLFGVASALTFAAAQALIFHRIAAFESAGWSVALIAGLASIAGIAGLPGRYLAPVASERYPSVAVHAFLDVALAASALFIIGGSSVWNLAGHFVLYGLFFGAISPMRAVVMGAWFSGPAYGRILGAQWTVTAVIGAIAPGIVGIVKDASGSYDGPMIGVGIALVLGAALTLAAGRQRRTSGAAAE